MRVTIPSQVTRILLTGWDHYISHCFPAYAQAITYSHGSLSFYGWKNDINLHVQGSNMRHNTAIARRDNDEDRMQWEQHALIATPEEIKQKPNPKTAAAPAIRLQERTQYWSDKRQIVKCIWDARSSMHSAVNNPCCNYAHN